MCCGNTKIEWPKGRGSSGVTGHVKQEGIDWDIKENEMWRWVGR